MRVKISQTQCLIAFRILSVEIGFYFHNLSVIILFEYASPVSFRFERPPFFSWRLRSNFGRYLFSMLMGLLWWLSQIHWGPFLFRMWLKHVFWLVIFLSVLFRFFCIRVTYFLCFLFCVKFGLLEGISTNRDFKSKLHWRCNQLLSRFHVHMFVFLWKNFLMSCLSKKKELNTSERI